MDVQKHKVGTNSLQMHYLKAGNGSRQMVVFHGYSQSSEQLQFLEEWLPDYTLYMLDLFFHGDSHFPSSRIPNQPLLKSEFKEIMSQLIEREELKDITVLGYSLGGRYAMNFVTQFGHTVDKLILIAPDGILKQFWNRTMLNVPPMRAVYRWVIGSNRLTNFLTGFVRVFKLAPRSRIKFAKKHMEGDRGKNLVLDNWLALSEFDPDLAKLESIRTEHQIGLTLVFGEHDKVIGLPVREKANRALTPDQIVIIEGSHNLLKPKYLNQYSSVFE